MLLDVDGTLVDSNAAHARAWAYALHRFGYRQSAAEIQQWVGMGGDKILARIDAGLRDDAERAPRFRGCASVISSRTKSTRCGRRRETGPS